MKKYPEYWGKSYFSQCALECTTFFSVVATATITQSQARIIKSQKFKFKFGSSSSYERIPNASNEYSQIIKPLGWRSLQHTRVAQHFFQTARNATPTGATHPAKKLPKPCSFTTGVSNRSAGPCILKFDNEQYARNVCYSCKSGQTSLHPVGLVAVVHAPKNEKTN